MCTCKCTPAPAAHPGAPGMGDLSRPLLWVLRPSFPPPSPGTQDVPPPHPPAAAAAAHLLVRLGVQGGEGPQGGHRILRGGVSAHLGGQALGHGVQHSSVAPARSTRQANRSGVTGNHQGVRGRGEVGLADGTLTGAVCTCAGPSLAAWGCQDFKIVQAVPRCKTRVCHSGSVRSKPGPGTRTSHPPAGQVQRTACWCQHASNQLPVSQLAHKQ